MLRLTIKAEASRGHTFRVGIEQVTIRFDRLHLLYLPFPSTSTSRPFWTVCICFGVVIHLTEVLSIPSYIPLPNMQGTDKPTELPHWEWTMGPTSRKGKSIRFALPAIFFHFFIFDQIRRMNKVGAAEIAMCPNLSFIVPASKQR